MKTRSSKARVKTALLFWGAPFFIALASIPPSQAGTLPPIPAAEILESIQLVEQENEINAYESEIDLTSGPRNASTIVVEWEAGAMPEAMRSWMYWHLSDEVLNELRNNRSRITQEPLL